MPILQHYPWEIKTYRSGADSDTNKEVFAIEGKYVDSRNGRLKGDNGQNDSLEKIKGEVVTYPKNFTTGDYFCIGAWNVNDDIVEFWADRNFVEDPLIRVNGAVVAKSSKLGFRSDRPLQGDTNDSCVGGEIFVTDYEQPPFIFNIKDMVDSLAAGSTKYFSSFNPDLYAATLKTPLDIMVFKDLVNVGGGGGLPYGDYAYSMRYVTEDGDRTNFSLETPLIPVPASNGSASVQYPWIKTYGGSPNPSFKSTFGIRLKFRVTNLYNYNYIEIRRVAYNTGAGFTFIPTAKIIAKIPIVPGQISVEEFIDPNDAFSEPLTVGDDEDLQLFSTIQTCKTLRYYNKRLVLMNLKYPSKDVQGVKFLEDPDGTSGFPIVEPLYDRGYTDPWYYAYRRNLLSGERYNYGAIILDASGGPSFAVQMSAAQMADIKTVPNHRDQLSLKSIQYCVSSGKGAPNLADIQNNKNYVHEVWSMEGSVIKNDRDSIQNLCNEALIGDPEPYGILNPISDQDADTADHDYRVNVGARVDGTSTVPYNPKGFKPHYWSHGIAFKGIKKSTLPSWAKAFAYVRTKSAKRVVVQGIGIYKLSPAKKTGIGIGYVNGISKATNEFVFYSTDIEHGLVDAAVIADMQANPTNYKVQLLSPVGYFSEMYNDVIKPLNRDEAADLITYARVQDEDGSINPTETSGQVKYGQYLNPTPVTIGATSAPDYGNYKYGVLSFQSFMEGRGTYYHLKLDAAVYGFGSQGGSHTGGWDIEEGKDFKEPFYIINIIKDGAEPPKGNTTNYYQTGHYQKLTSIIGRTTGVAEDFELVDERWEDCIPNFRDSNASNINTYLFIEDPNGLEHVWLNVKFKTPAQRATIFFAIDNFGFYNDGTYNIEGCYDSTVDSLERLYTIQFKIMDPLYSPTIFIPESGSLVKVRYDERFPIAVFPGEHFVGETVFCPIDRYSNGDDTDPDATTQFLFASGMPYHGYDINTNYLIMLKSYGAGNNVQDVNFNGKLDYIRQWMVMFPSENRACHALEWGDKFPNRHYVMRPYRYKITSNMSTDNNKMYSNYFTDYPGEEGAWGYGGFKFPGTDNPDYSCSLNDRIYTSKPLVGFKEQNNYCSRIIWSLQRPTYAQDAPGLKTFPSLNVKDISDNQGCIKYAYDANSANGQNLYAVCSRGVCLLITEKNLLSDANAGQLAYMKSENFINDERWLSKDVGMNDETWRTAAETSAATYGKSRIESLFFTNKESSYVLVDNSVMDITSDENSGYHKALYTQLCKVMGVDYTNHVCAGYDRKHNEYWVHINPERGSAIIITGYPTLYSSTSKEEGKLLLLNGASLSFVDSTVTNFYLPDPEPDAPFEVVLCNNGTGSVRVRLVSGSIINTISPNSCIKVKIQDGEYVVSSFSPETDQTDTSTKTFVYNQSIKTWTGWFDYRFDKFLGKYQDMHGMRNLETHTLNQGYLINGQPIQFEAIQSHAPDPAADKEFIRVKINSSKKPTRVEFFKESDGSPQSWLDSSSGTLYLKDYRGYEQYIPRTDASINVNRPRIQGRLLFYRIFHNLQEDFRLMDSGVMYKKIK